MVIQNISNSVRNEINLDGPGPSRSVGKALLDALCEVRSALRPAAIGSAALAAAGTPMAAQFLIGGLAAYIAVKGSYNYFGGLSLNEATRLIVAKRPGVLEKLKDLRYAGLDAQTVYNDKRIISEYENVLNAFSSQAKLEFALQVIKCIERIEKNHHLMEEAVEKILEGIHECINGEEIRQVIKGINFQSVDADFYARAKESLKKGFFIKQSGSYAVCHRLRAGRGFMSKHEIYVLWGTVSARDKLYKDYLLAVTEEQKNRFPEAFSQAAEKANEGASKAEICKLTKAEMDYPLDAYLDRLREVEGVELPYDRIDSCLPSVAESVLRRENLPSSQNLAAVPAFESVNELKTPKIPTSKGSVILSAPPAQHISVVANNKRVKPINEIVRSPEFDEIFIYLPENARHKIEEIENDIRWGRLSTKTSGEATLIYDLAALNLGHQRGKWRLYVRQLANNNYMSDYIVDYHRSLPKKWQP